MMAEHSAANAGANNPDAVPATTIEPSGGPVPNVEVVTAEILGTGEKPVSIYRVGTLTYTTAGLMILFCWLLWGDFAWSMKDRSVGPVAQILLVKYHGSALTNSLLFGVLPQGIALLLGLWVGSKSDRYRSRWGRRIPFLLIPTPIAVLGILGLALTPALGAHLNTATHGKLDLDRSVLLVLAVCWTTFEIATIVANSVFGGLINDVVPGALLGRFYGMFRAFSLIAGMLFNFWIVDKAKQYYAAIFIGIGLLYGGGFALMCLKVKEGKYPTPPPLTSETANPLLSAFRYVAECFARPYYLLLFAAMALPSMAMSQINLFTIPFVNSLNMSMGTYGKLLTLTYLLSLLQTYPLGWLADRFHPLRVGAVCLFLHACATAWGMLYIHDSNTYSIALVLHGVLSGSWFTATAAFPATMLPKGRFAQFASASSVVTGIGTLLVSLAMGEFIKRNHPYRITFTTGLLLDAGGLLLTVVLYKRFRELGGPRNYAAPE